MLSPPDDIFPTDSIAKLTSVDLIDWGRVKPVCYHPSVGGELIIILGQTHRPDVIPC